MRKAAAVLAAVAVVLVAGASPAAAHAELSESSPVNGARLDAPPERVLLTFTEPVEVSVGGIRVYDADGERIDRGRPHHPEARGSLVALDLDGLGEGAYVVTWRVVSADSHPVHGAFTFRVGDTGDEDTEALAERLLAADGGDTLVGGLHATARVLLFGALLVLIGGAAFVAALWPAGASNRSARLTVGGALVAAAVATVAGIGLQGAYGAGLGVSGAVDPDVLSAVADTRYGRAGLARLALLTLTAGLLVATGRRRAPAWALAGLALAGVGLLATVAASGHATTGRWVAAAFTADVVHLAAAAVWLGGLAVLTVALLRGGDAQELAAVVTRFSQVAFAAVVVLLATGGFQSWRQLGEVDALTGTTYGSLLTVKLVVFGAMVGLAALSRSWVRRRYRPAAPVSAGPGAAAAGADDVDVAPLRRSVAAEAVAAVAVIVVTALLVNAIPGRTALALPHTTELAVGDELLVDVTVDPAEAGPLDLHLYTLTPAGLPVEVEEVTARLALADRDIGPVTVPLQRAGPNHFVAYGFDVPIAGDWRLDVTVRTSDVEQETASTTIPIE